MARCWHFSRHSQYNQKSSEVHNTKRRKSHRVAFGSEEPFQAGSRHCRSDLNSNKSPGPGCETMYNMGTQRRMTDNDPACRFTACVVQALVRGYRIQQIIAGGVSSALSKRKGPGLVSDSALESRPICGHKPGCDTPRLKGRG